MPGARKGAEPNRLRSTPLDAEIEAAPSRAGVRGAFARVGWTRSMPKASTPVDGQIVYGARKERRNAARDTPLGPTAIREDYVAVSLNRSMRARRDFTPRRVAARPSKTPTVDVAIPSS